jgi:hypothetical protein
MEVQRLCHVLELHLSTRTYMVGEEYTIADMMIYPWFAQIRPPNGLGSGYPHKASGNNAANFLSTAQYTHLNAWADRIAARPAVQRGVTVCSFMGMVPKVRRSSRPLYSQLNWTPPCCHSTHVPHAFPVSLPHRTAPWQPWLVAKEEAK